MPFIMPLPEPGVPRAAWMAFSTPRQLRPLFPGTSNPSVLPCERNCRTVRHSHSSKFSSCQWMSRVFKQPLKATSGSLPLPKTPQGHLCAHRKAEEGVRSRVEAVHRELQAEALNKDAHRDHLGCPLNGRHNLRKRVNFMKDITFYASSKNYCWNEETTILDIFIHLIELETDSCMART